MLAKKRLSDGGVVGVSGEGLTVGDVVRVGREGGRVALGDGVRRRMGESREVVRRIVEEGRVVYGVTTGFGDLSTKFISPEETRKLQRNLVRSHAVGTGPMFPTEVVRGVMLLSANKLAKGLSGVAPAIAEMLVECLNKGIHPLVPSQGSVGASGDLAPLAHVAQVLIGEGEVDPSTTSEYGLPHSASLRAKGSPGLASLGSPPGAQAVSGAEALSKRGLKPLELGPKEGLALLNGTEVSTALGAFAVHDAWSLLHGAVAAGAMSLEALKGSDKPFDARLQEVRPHEGQGYVARQLRHLLRESETTVSHPWTHKIQDPYSLRCMPQVMGASYDAIRHCWSVVEREMNSATDNPLVFGGEVLSGGNFHAQPIALAMGYLKIAACEIASLSERRTYLLLDASRSGLPQFLAKNPGVESGLMIAQNLAAALVSENKGLSHPASVDSIPTSAGMEDHVSMAPIAGRQALQIIDNAMRVVAVELLAASQGLYLSEHPRPGRGVEEAVAMVRRVATPLEGDRSVSGDVVRLAGLVREGRFMGMMANGG
ncbi:MAG: histidine ammonia-lyase [SAR202 cluster bacterium]|nr:histidine ammonia-lyase [SAR202 cluster bacterium]